MRAVRLLLSATALSAAFLVSASPAAAQTTTTIPPVRSIPVTGGQTTTTVAPAESTGSTTETAAGGLADTGLAGDMLVPLAFGLIGGGAALQVAARRRTRNAYGLL